MTEQILEVVLKLLAPILTAIVAALVVFIRAEVKRLPARMIALADLLEERADDTETPVDDVAADVIRAVAVAMKQAFTDQPK